MGEIHPPFFNNMSLQEQIILDVARITSDPNGFNVPVSFIATTGETAQIYAPGNEIGRKIDSGTGVIVNSKNASIVFSEMVLLAANPDYPVRNAGKEISMVGHRISFPNSTGEVKNYIVQETPPDETVGLITLLLGDFE